MATTIQTISDTALLTAWYRAQESARPDALFHDPYAALLAGERAEQMTRALPGDTTTGFPIVVRTVALDAYLARLIAEQHPHSVLNLAAGLDTRPYRLALPSTLRWVEVDFADILTYKAERLAPYTPACLVERIPLDLTDASARQQCFAALQAEASSVVVLTEGLLNYLPETLVRMLAQELARYDAMQWWCTDMASPLLRWILQRVWGPALRSGATQFQFAPADEARFFAECGWQIVQRADPRLARQVHREVSLERVFRLIRQIPLPQIQRTFRFGDDLLLANRRMSRI